MRLFFVSIIVLLLSITTSFANDIRSAIEGNPFVVSVENYDANEYFEGGYLLMVKQPIDHSDPTKGYFTQRVFLGHYNSSAPTVVVTEGYSASYANNSRYLNELTTILKTNQVVIEHRYFSESVPEGCDWNYLTVEDAAADHHAVIEFVRSIYSNKIITTGISKGGQTVMYHSMLYPEDADIAVPYVAPLNFSYEDKRHSKFLKTVPGTVEDRAKLLEFQKRVLTERKAMVALLSEYTESKGYKYRIGLDEVLDLMVLEYPFAFWQWGTPISTVPSLDDNQAMFDHMLSISGPDYFAIDNTITGTASFFVQARHEIGYYAYDAKPLKRLLSIKNADEYLNRVFLPTDRQFKYDGTMSKRTQKYLDKKAKNMLLVYGEWDPWSATAAVVKKNPGVKIYFVPEMSHKARISNMPMGMKIEVITQLEEWLAE